MRHTPARRGRRMAAARPGVDRLAQGDRPQGRARRAGSTTRASGPSRATTRPGGGCRSAASRAAPTPRRRSCPTPSPPPARSPASTGPVAHRQARLRGRRRALGLEPRPAGRPGPRPGDLPEPHLHARAGGRPERARPRGARHAAGVGSPPGPRGQARARAGHRDRADPAGRRRPRGDGPQPDERRAAQRGDRDRPAHRRGAAPRPGDEGEADAACPPASRTRSAGPTGRRRAGRTSRSGARRAA